MKRFLLPVFMMITTTAFTQEKETTPGDSVIFKKTKDKSWVRVIPSQGRKYIPLMGPGNKSHHPDTLKSPLLFNPRLPAGVYQLPQDGMPCIVPDMNATVTMPNAFRNQRIPFNSGMPNPYRKDTTSKIIPRSR